MNEEFDPALSGDMCLKFDSEEQMLSVLFEDIATEWESTTDEETGEVTRTPTAFESRPKYPNTDLIGLIYRPTGKTLTDEEGNEYPEQAPLDGFHVNIRANEPISELESYRVYPATPYRVWA